MLEYLEGHTGPFDNQYVYRKMKCPCASAYRAYGELEAFGLIDRTPRGILFRPNAKYAFRLLLPRLKCSPYRDALIAAIYGETGAHHLFIRESIFWAVCHMPPCTFSGRSRRNSIRTGGRCP